MELPLLRPRLFTRSPLAVFVALALGAAASNVDALGFGRAQTTAVLGMPLDFRVGLRLDDNETLDPTCIASTVMVGDSMVPQSAVSIVLDGAGAAASLRVATSVPMTEPLVVVSITAGCTVKVNRRFTLFADPPGHRVAPIIPPPQAVASAPSPAMPAPQVTLPAGAVIAPPAVLPLAPSSGAGAAPGPAPAPAPTAEAPPAAPARQPSAPAPAPVAPTPPAPVSAPVAAAPQAPPAQASTASRPTPTPAPAPKATQKAIPKAPAKEAAKAAPTSPKGGDGAASAKTAPVPQPAEPPAQAKAAPPAGAPRLKLEAPKISPRVIDAAAAAEREAALRNAEEAAISAKAAAEAAEARASQLERSIALLQQESKANREALLRLTQAIEESKGSDYGSIALLAAVAGLLGVSGFLFYRLRQMQKASNADWVRVAPEGEALTQDAQASSGDLGGRPSANQEGTTQGVDLERRSLDAPSEPVAVGGFPSVAVPDVEPDSTGGPRPGAWAPTTLGEDTASGPPLPSLSLGSLAGTAASLPEEEAPLDRTRLLPPSAVSVSPPIRTVSIEELLDLEQQVEFYTVLGQDDAALGLLVEHLRHTGGTYPLPFLKLMELYRRKGDADAYERTRDRFNQRFNAVAPAWGAPPVPQRGLDEYPEVMRQIQQAWSRPVDASAMLENMLFRTQGGELFDLAALADVLFLFTLARDLLDNESGEVTSVDVLLPLEDSGSTDFGQMPTTASPPPISSPAASPPMPAIDLPSTSAAPASAPGQTRTSPAAGAAGVAAVAAIAVSAAAPIDDIDIPLGEPMLDPLFVAGSDDGESAVRPSPAGGQAAPRVDGADLPDLDLDLGFETDEPAQAAAPAARSPDRALDFDVSEFDLPVALVTPPGAAPASESPASLDFDIDGLSLEPAPARKPPESGGSPTSA